MSRSETVNCNFCGHNETDFITSQTDRIHKTTEEIFQIVRCKFCGLAYTNPRPKSTEMHKYYSKTYSYHTRFSPLKRYLLLAVVSLANSRFPSFFLPSIISRRISIYVTRRIKDPVRDFYNNNVGSGAILDIGCGSGQHAHYWGVKGALVSYSKFAQVYGVEISEASRSELGKYNIESWSDIDEVPRDLTFGVIRLNWSLEHVYNPGKYFEFINNYLKKDGIAVIGVPNYNGLIYIMDKSCVELPIHLYHFRPKDIENYAEKYSLSIVKIETFSYPQMFIEASRLGMFVSGLSEQLLLGEARTLQNILNKLDSENMGNDMVVILKHVDQ